MSQPSLTSAITELQQEGTAPQHEGLVVEPARNQFIEAYGNGLSQVVWTRLVADLETPVSAFLKISDGRPLSA
jgi:hypothetical protein